MAATNSMPLDSSRLYFRDYPPGSTLFEYFVTANTSYSEGAVYFAHFILLAAALAVFFEGFRWRQAHWIALTAAFVLVAVQVQKDVFLVLYVDTLLGAYLAAAVYMQLAARSPVKLMPLAAAVLFALPLFKKTGYFLSIAAVLVILADMAMRALPGNPYRRRVVSPLAGAFGWAAGVAGRAVARRQMILFYAAAAAAIVATAVWRGWARPGGLFVVAATSIAAAGAAAFLYRAGVNGRSRAARRAGIVAATAVLVLSPFAAAAGWDWWVVENRLPTTFNMRSTVLDAFREATAPTAEATRAVVSGFKEHVISAPIRAGKYSVYAKVARLVTGQNRGAGGLSAAGWAAFVAILAAAVVFIAGPGARVRYALAFGVLFAFLAAYLAGLLMLYIGAFSDYEARTLAEFERYAWIYLLGMALAGWALLAREASRKGREFTGKAALGLAALAATWVYVIENSAYIPLPDVPARLAARDVIAPQLALVRSVTRPRDNVFVIYEHTNTREIKILHFELPELRVNGSHYSLGAKLGPGDIYTYDITAAQWAEMLREGRYKYVYVAYADAQFREKYAALFQSGTTPEDFLFEVRQPDGGVLLKPVRTK
jgi:hypothetical protein